MSKTRIRTTALALGPLALLAVAPSPRPRSSRRATCEVKFEGELTPRSLPRASQAPVNVSVSAKITPVGNAELPQLRTDVDRDQPLREDQHQGPAGLRTRTTSSPRPPPTRSPSAASSLVGEGTFTANVPESGRAPFPAEGKLYAFNGVSKATRRSSPTSTACGRRRPPSPWSS